MILRNIRKVILFLLISIYSNGQVVPLSIKSPQSYEMERYGNIPVNLNTGGIDLSIPIFAGNISGTSKNFSISLDYNSSGFIPAKKSNYVGSNWFLNYGGAITRDVKGVADDIDHYNGGVKGYLVGLRKYNKTNNDIYNGNFTQGVQYRATIDILNNGYGGYAEIISDKYNFSFMGKKGYFYIGNDGKPLLFSEDSNMKIDISGISAQHNYNCTPEVSEIKITDGEGIIYYFGGNAENLEVSYDMGGGNATTPVPIDSSPKHHITSWCLRKVVFTNGKEINFYYKTDTGLSTNNFCMYAGRWNPSGVIDTNREPSYDLSIAMNQINSRYSFTADFSWGGSHYWGEGNGFSYTYSVAYNLVKKVIPERITFDSAEILFNYIIYDRAATTKDYKSYKLSNITVKNNNSDISKIDFNYFRNGYYTFLSGLNINNKPYSFDYYKKDITLPTPYTYGVDFLGYWNGGGETTNRLIPEYQIADNGDFTILGTSRNPSPTLFDATLLRKVTYPTTGYSEFIYEPHQYSKKIDRNAASQFLPVLINQSGTIGGARIKKIIDFDGTQSVTREYKYVKNLLPNSQSTESSGISNSYIRFFELLNYSEATPGNSNGVRRSSLTETANNMIPSTYSNSPINYTEVTELLNDRFNKKFLFSGLDTVSDTLTIRKTKPYAATSNFNPPFLVENLAVRYNSQETYRNNLLKTIFYKDNDRIKEIENKYTKLLSSNRFSNYYHSSVGGKGDWIYFYKEFIYPSLLSSTITTDYVNGNQLQTKTEYYYTNPVNNNLIRQVNVLPDTTLESSYSYANDTGKQYLIGKNMLGIPLTTEIKKTFNGITKTISKTETVYPTSEADAKSKNIDNKGVPVPFDLLKSDLQTPFTLSLEISYDKYDGNGNPLQYTTKADISTAIIWGYNNTQPIAKIEGVKYDDIKGKADIATIISVSNTDAAQAPRTGESSILNALDNFRKSDDFKNYQITTYTYDPLIGIRSITAPNGLRENYIYDTENKLERITDVNGEILKEFKYNYAPMKYYSAEKSQTFIRNNCGSNAVGSTYIYTVSANQYSSIISQDDANQKAQDDINTNGQNAANQNGICYPVIQCPFIKSSAINNTAIFSSTTTNVSNYVNFSMAISPYNLNLNWNGGVMIGTTSADCRPLSVKNFTYNETGNGNNRMWNITIESNGNCTVKLTQGIVDNTSYSPLIFQFQYQK